MSSSGPARDLVVGLDCSTTAVKAIAFDLRGEGVAEGRAALAIDNPAPDAWEQDAADWWRGGAAALRDLARELGPTGVARLAGIGVTHQRETFVLADDAAEPLLPAILWMDGRGVDHVERLVTQLGRDRLAEVTGKPPCITPSLYKIARLLADRPDLAARRPAILEVGAFVVERLTGVRATSTASADPTGLVDMVNVTYAPDILAALGVESAQLPAMVPPGTVVGGLTASAASMTGLPAGLAIVAGAGDGQAAGVGAGITGPGRAYLNLGTAIVSGVLHDRYVWGDGFRTMFGGRPGSYFLETDLKGGTFTFTWLVDKLCGVPPAEQGAALDRLAERAAELPPGAEGLLLLPYFCGVMNPFWDDAASGLVMGLRGSHGPHHLYRAIAEGIALEQRLHTERVEAAVGPISEMIVMGGPAGSDPWCRILADVLERRIVRASTKEATALGAAILAASGVGAFPTLDAAAAAMTRTGVGFEPGPNRAAYGDLYRDVYRGLFDDVRARMSRLERWRLAHPVSRHQ